MTTVTTKSIVVEEQQPDHKEQQLRDKQLFKQLEETMLALKRDPSLYVEEVKRYTLMFKEEFRKVSEATQKKSERFGQLAIFLCRCSTYYTADMKFLAEYLMELLTNYINILHPYNRRKAVSGIIILRSKNVLFPVSTLQFLIGLLGVEDKELRKTIYTFVLNDLQRINRHRRNNTINRQLQSWIHDYIKKNSDRVARKMINLSIELYKKNVWQDAKIVNIIATGCFSQSYKIRLISSYFLISTTEPTQEVSQDDEEQKVDPGKIKLRKGVTKVTKNKQKQVEKQKRRAERKLKRRIKTETGNRFFPIDQIYNPHEFSEKLYSVMAKKDEKFVVRVIIIALLSRMINRHKLMIMPFYGMLQKYMHPGQKDVGKILACFAESVHSQVPETELQPIIKHIVQHFVNDRCTEFAMTMGLNVLRELFIKNPLLFDSDMMMYLCTYYQYKNRNVCAAAKSLINVVRDSHPQLLEKKYRGRVEREAEVKDTGVCERIDGAQLLGEDREFPVFYDRILTDEDFRRIRVLKKKKEMMEAKQAMMGEASAKQEEQQEEQADGESADEAKDDIQQVSNDSEDGSALDEEEQWQTVKEDDDKEPGGEQQSELDWDNAEEVDQEQQEEEENLNPEQKKRKQIKQKSRKRKPSLSQIDSDDVQLSEKEDEDPHGFINENRITFYKKSKGEVKADKRQLREEQGHKKFVHTPKQKGGGTTDKEKLKNKPLMMLRPKKNKLRLREKQVKSKIKDLKNKLGRAKGGKQAKRMKTKKITNKISRKCK